MRDLFVALIDEENERTHPLLLGLLYTFCPKAAWWSQAGVEPDVPHDAVWYALQALTAGQTLKDALMASGFDETILDDVQQYVDDVDAFRAQCTGIPAPETTLFFIQARGKLSPTNRFEFDIRTDDGQFEGTWEGFYEFVRTYVFLFEDWAAGLNMPQTVTVESVTLSLSLPTVRQAGSVRWPAWLWQYGRRQVITALADAPHITIAAHRQQNTLRLTLFDNADRVDSRWTGTPEVWMLDRMGNAVPFAPITTLERISRIVEQQSVLAAEGPYPPLGALMVPRRCDICGFRSVCWEGDGLRDEYGATPENTTRTAREGKPYS